MAGKKRKASAHPSLTVDDVAQRAGVSRTAVSYVLNENGTRNKHVSEEARAKILQAVQDLNFHPHAVARALSTGQSNEIAMILWPHLSAFAIELITSIQHAAAIYGYACVLYPTEELTVEQKQILHQTILARRPTGIIIGSNNFTAEDIALARQMGIRMIFLSEYTKRTDSNVYIEPPEESHAVFFPSWALGYLAAQHLLARGHRRLALVQPIEHVPNEIGFSQRLKGMQAAMTETSGATLDTLPLHFSPASARSLIETTFQGSARPTGIYAYNDEFAIVLLGALMHAGIRVPQEVALIGTDNLTIGECIWPSLTTINFDVLDIGKRVVEMFHTLDQGLPLPEELTRPLAPQLIQRETT